MSLRTRLRLFFILLHALTSASAYLLFQALTGARLSFTFYLVAAATGSAIGWHNTRTPKDHRP